MDLPAGPSEVLVIADESADPAFAAADLLSQAEHGEDSCAILLCCSLDFARATRKAIERGIEERPKRREIKIKSIREHSFALIFEDWERLYDFANRYAPEHLELCVKEPKLALKRSNMPAAYSWDTMPLWLWEIIAAAAITFCQQGELPVPILVWE